MHLPIAVAAVFLKVTDQRLWRIVFHYADAAVARMDLSGVTRVSVADARSADTVLRQPTALTRSRELPPQAAPHTTHGYTRSAPTAF